MKKVSWTLYIVGILLFLSSCGELENNMSDSSSDLSSDLSSYGYSNISNNQITDIKSSSNVNNSRWTRDSLNNIVIDNYKKLIWQDDKDVVEKKHSYTNAKQYCNNLSTSSLKNWRLPSISELSSLIDESEKRKISPIFQNHKQTFHFSNDALSGNKSSIWGVHFQVGFNLWMSANRELHIRCVANLL